MTYPHALKGMVSEKKKVKVISIREHKHHYPFFIRWYDALSISGKSLERHCYCFKCEKEFIIRFNLEKMYMPHVSYGLEKGRETIEKLRKQLPEIIRKYNKNTGKNIKIPQRKKEVGIPPKSN